MRKQFTLGGYSFSIGIEKNNHLLPHSQANQKFHFDFNIYKKGEEQ